MPDIRPLPEDLQKIAIEQLNEVPQRLDADLLALRTWIEQQPHLRARTDDQFLVGFLRGCKYSLEKAKSKLDKFYTLRTKYPDFYMIRDVDSERMQELVRMGVGVPLPIPLHENGPRLIYVRPGLYPADRYTFDDVMAVANTMNNLTLLLDDYALVNGLITLLDFTDYSGAHLLQMTPTVMKKMTIFAEEAMPVRDKGTHMIHTNAAFEAVFNVMRPLMPAKKQERLSVHGSNLEALYAYIPQKYLPKHLGGEQGCIDTLKEGQWNTFQKYRDYLRDELKYGVDEKLRPGGQQIDYDHLFGVDGSFRKLNVD
ncbi:alpha-tocopherol transfer protein-like [Scaptodrosophila lebanonensis]|uniref:Alpha-tocopherol transfer protein-like n=1 Tax=Drosophila lebanonensis TaxID=7225 RepID=A0A6J2TDT5_DROLE|nr:alpha-tocopherol transfer protein-like [Scaptodrosophila lebanonensis]